MWNNRQPTVYMCGLGWLHTDPSSNGSVGVVMNTALVEDMEDERTLGIKFKVRKLEYSNVFE